MLGKNIFYRSSWYEDPRYNSLSYREPNDPYYFEISVQCSHSWPELFQLLKVDLSTEALFGATPQTPWGSRYYLSNIDPIRFYAQLARLALCVRKDWLFQYMNGDYAYSSPQFLDVFLRRKFIDPRYKNRLEVVGATDIVQNSQLLFTLSNITSLHPVSPMPRSSDSVLFTDSLYTQFLDRYNKLVRSRDRWVRKNKENFYSIGGPGMNRAWTDERKTKEWFKLLYTNEIEETEPFLQFLKELSDFDRSGSCVPGSSALTWDSIKVHGAKTASAAASVPLQSIPEPKPTPSMEPVTQASETKPEPVKPVLNTESSSREAEASKGNVFRNSNNFGMGYGNEIARGFLYGDTNKLFPEREPPQKVAVETATQKAEVAALIPEPEPEPELTPLEVVTPSASSSAPEEEPSSVKWIGGERPSKHIDWSKVWAE